MFCCTKRQDHFGQIVNTVCLQEECIKNKNQLSCPLCVQQEHRNHSLTTMKKMLPEFLSANREKQKYLALLSHLLDFVLQNFGEQNTNGQNVVVQNVIMADLKNQVEGNNQEIFKMKDIFKNLNKNANQSSIPVSKSTVLASQMKIESNFSPKKSSGLNSPGKTSKYTNLNSQKSLKGQFQHFSGTIDTFSHSLKHPYLSLSSDFKSVNKSSHPGHRYSVLNSKSLTTEQNQVHVKIDSSSSGNIMIGLCHESIVKQKDFVNNYGTSHGTYLIGQNGNSLQTAISFHHTTNMMNRKEIVGWNFAQGETVTVGFNFREQIIYFKLHRGKGSNHLLFQMALVGDDFAHKDQIRKQVMENGLKFIVLLQNIGDQVTLLQY